MTRVDLDQQADYGDGTLGWTAELVCANTYHRLVRVHCRAVDEATAYEVARQKIQLRGFRTGPGRTIVIKRASYADLELQPIQGAM